MTLGPDVDVVALHYDGGGTKHVFFKGVPCRKTPPNPQKFKAGEGDKRTQPKDKSEDDRTAAVSSLPHETYCTVVCCLHIGVTAPQSVLLNVS